MTPSEMLQKIDELTAEAELTRKTADILAKFEELHRQASRDSRLNMLTRDTHCGLARAMSEEISDVLSVANKMDEAKKELIAKLRQSVVSMNTEVASA